MKEIEPAPDLARLLKAHHTSGGVVDYVLVGPPETATERYLLHRQCALVFMDAVERRHAAHLQKAIDSGLRVHSDELRFNVQTGKAVGHPVTVRDFLGRWYHWDSGMLIHHADSLESDEGYAYAFGFPPHGSVPKKGLAERSNLFRAINTELFGDSPDDLEVFRWSTDWSRYFDPGHEWWGSYLWTVAPPSRPYLVGIGASTTD